MSTREGALAVDGAGFHVEVDVLEDAAKGMRSIVADQDARELRDVCGDSSRYGHARVYGELAGFSQAWSVGIDALCDRARTMGAELDEAARTYREVDQDTARMLTQDPGIDAVQPASDDALGH